MPRKLKAHVPLHRRGKQPSRPAYTAIYYTKQWKAVRAAALLRAEWQCEACGRELRDFDATVDHRIELAQGGAAFDLSNLQALCRSCNSAKGRAYQQGRAWAPANGGGGEGKREALPANRQEPIREAAEGHTSFSRESGFTPGAAEGLS
jgi:5-methylcytosine-specific restriction endonuclease McrA